jgi:hypothetical protein
VNRWDGQTDDHLYGLINFENIDSLRIEKALIEEIGDQTLRPYTIGSIKYTCLFDPKSNEYTVVPVPIKGSDFIAPLLDTFRVVFSENRQNQHRNDTIQTQNRQYHIVAIP